MTIECTDAIPVFDVIASDNCDQLVDVILSDSISTQAANDCYTITRTWIATDNCGNSDSVSQILTVIDTVGPTFTNAPIDNTIECTDDIPELTITATDNCDQNVDVVQVDSTSTQAANDCYTITRTWIATDNCGNTETHIHNLTVIDTLQPVFTNAPVNTTVECSEDIPTFVVLSTDNCDTLVEVVLVDSTSTQAANDCYEISRTWIATDNCGNSEVHTQLTTVIDTIRPVFVNSQADLTIECTDAIPTYNIEATDNCDQIVDVVLSDSTSTQSLNDCYEITRTWIASDNCGNSESFTQVVTVIDTVGPIFVDFPTDETITCIDGIPNYTLTGQDNCDADVTITLIDSISTQMIGGVEDDNCFAITRTWSISDNCGNTDIHTQTVTMTDTILSLIHI